MFDLFPGIGVAFCFHDGRLQRLGSFLLSGVVGAEETALEQQNIEDAHGDGRIGQVKNRAEKSKRIAAKKREPIGVIPPQNRKIKHIYHPAVQKSGITAVFRKKLGNAAVILLVVLLLRRPELFAKWLAHRVLSAEETQLLTEISGAEQCGE